MIIQVPEREFTEKELNVHSSVLNKIMEEVDFQDDNIFNSLTTEEQYYYLGLTRGINNVFITMTADDNPDVIKYMESKFEIESEEDAIKRMEQE